MCTTDGRLRIFINEKADSGIAEAEVEDDSYPDFEGEEVSVHESDEDDSEEEEEKKE